MFFDSIYQRMPEYKPRFVLQVKGTQRLTVGSASIGANLSWDKHKRFAVKIHSSFA